MSSQSIDNFWSHFFLLCFDFFFCFSVLGMDPRASHRLDNTTKPRGHPDATSTAITKTEKQAILPIERQLKKKGSKSCVMSCDTGLPLRVSFLLSLLNDSYFVFWHHIRYSSASQSYFSWDHFGEVNPFGQLLPNTTAYTLKSSGEKRVMALKEEITLFVQARQGLALDSLSLRKVTMLKAELKWLKATWE